jgi:hypothetical protein
MDAPSATESYDQLIRDPRVFAVHVGFKPESVRDIPHFAPAAADGDGWNVWGEAPGTAGNDEDTHHVVILTTEPDIMVEALSMFARPELVPMVGQGQLGTIIVVTDKDEWSVVHHAVTK